MWGFDHLISQGSKCVDSFYGPSPWWVIGLILVYIESWQKGEVQLIESQHRSISFGFPIDRLLYAGDAFWCQLSSWYCFVTWRRLLFFCCLLKHLDIEIFKESRSHQGSEFWTPGFSVISWWEVFTTLFSYVLSMRSPQALLVNWYWIWLCRWSWQICKFRTLLG